MDLPRRLRPRRCDRPSFKTSFEPSLVTRCQVAGSGLLQSEILPATLLFDPQGRRLPRRDHRASGMEPTAGGNPRRVRWLAEEDRAIDTARLRHDVEQGLRVRVTWA